MVMIYKADTKLILLQVPELNSYALILAVIEGSFRPAIHPGENKYVIPCFESSSTEVKRPSVKTFAENAHPPPKDFFLIIDDMDGKA